jgi:hypothetical protein
MKKNIISLALLATISVFGASAFAESNENCTYFLKYVDKYFMIGIDGKVLETRGFYQSYATDEIVRLEEIRKLLATKGYSETKDEKSANQIVSIGTAMICDFPQCGWPTIMSAHYMINQHTAKAKVHNWFHMISGVPYAPYDHDDIMRELVMTAFEKAQKRAFRSFQKDLPRCTK